jgi:hypothetical protein
MRPASTTRLLYLAKGERSGWGGPLAANKVQRLQRTVVDATSTFTRLHGHDAFMRFGGFRFASSSAVSGGHVWPGLSFSYRYFRM